MSINQTLTQSPTQLSTESPCIRKCCLDHQDICLGCYRHIDEIRQWSQRTNEEKLIILSACQQRKAMG